MASALDVVDGCEVLSAARKATRKIGDRFRDDAISEGVLRICNRLSRMDPEEYLSRSIDERQSYLRRVAMSGVFKDHQRRTRPKRMNHLGTCSLSAWADGAFDDLTPSYSVMGASPEAVASVRETIRGLSEVAAIAGAMSTPLMRASLDAALSPTGRCDRRVKPKLVKRMAKMCKHRRGVEWVGEEELSSYLRD